MGDRHPLNLHLTIEYGVSHGCVIDSVIRWRKSFQLLVNQILLSGKGIAFGPMLFCINGDRRAAFAHYSVYVV